MDKSEEEVIAGVAEQIELEERASKIRQAVLKDEAFMAGIRQAQQMEQSGDPGQPWPEVKRELGIV